MKNHKKAISATSKPLRHESRPSKPRGRGRGVTKKIIVPVVVNGGRGQFQYRGSNYRGRGYIHRGRGYNHGNSGYNMGGWGHNQWE